jgi:hypothetical protein
MIKNALFITAVAFIALFLLLLEECRFLIPYRQLLLYKYGTTILAFSAVLFLNVFTAVYLICRKVFLKDTGRKLLHLDNQMRNGASILDELSRYLAD